MAEVCYMRGYSVEELAALQQGIQQQLQDVPIFVGSTVLMFALARSLKGETADDAPAAPDIRVDPTPERIADLIKALDRCIPTFIRLSVDGITQEESVS